MRQFLLGLSVSLAFIAGCVASHIARIAVPPAHAGSPTQKWEYFCQKHVSFPWEREEGMSKLNLIGKEGWELVLQLNGHDSDVFCFKRPMN